MMQSSFSHVIGLSSAYPRGLCACIAHSISARQQKRAWELETEEAEGHMQGLQANQLISLME